MLRLIIRLLEPDSGEIKIDGSHVSAANVEEFVIASVTSFRKADYFRISPRAATCSSCRAI